MVTRTSNERVPSRRGSRNYNMARDYDPQTGRYVESDPVGIGGGLGTYSYVENTPEMMIDPDGLTGYQSPDGMNPRNAWPMCDGANGVTFKPSLLTPAEAACGLGDCVRAHELVHIMDLRALDRNVCRGQRRGIIPKFDTVPQNSASEDRAYDETVRCLKRKLRDACKNGSCRATIQSWLDYIPTGRQGSKTGRDP